VVVEPVSAGRNSQLRYADWVTGRREAVEAASDGRIGYLHIRAMGSGDIAEFAREFYANIDREGSSSTSGGTPGATSTAGSSRSS
jgi:tricorn protease